MSYFIPPLLPKYSAFHLTTNWQSDKKLIRHGKLLYQHRVGNMLWSSFCFSSLDVFIVSNKINVQLIEQIITDWSRIFMCQTAADLIISGKMSFTLIINGKCMASRETGIDIWLADRSRSRFSSRCTYSLNIPFLFSPWKGCKSIELVPFRRMQNTLGKDEISSVLCFDGVSKRCMHKLV